MKWEDLTAPEFVDARERAKGVCLVPIGVLERHGDHLPLGTDLHVVRAVALRAAEREPVVVFPPFYFGQILEAKHQPGTFALGLKLLYEILEAVCDEIGRNGFSKIVLIDGHGGNRYLLPHFCWSQLERERPYTLYLLGLDAYYGLPDWGERRETTVDGHGGEMETSYIMATHPDLVHPERLGVDGMPQGRGADLGGATTSIEWYADFPNQYSGDAAYATLEKGEALLEYGVARVAEALAKIKADETSPALFREFHDRSRKP